MNDKLFERVTGDGYNQSLTTYSIRMPLYSTQYTVDSLNDIRIPYKISQKDGNKTIIYTVFIQDELNEKQSRSLKFFLNDSVVSLPEISKRKGRITDG
jgi:hypothetical protein